MAKGARASTKKANNARLKSKVFNPVESARVERLSAKLLELASQPKLSQEEDILMDGEAENSVPEDPATLDGDEKDVEHMEIDQTVTATRSKTSGKGRIEKRRSSRKTSIVFPKYKNGKKVGKSKGKK